MEESRKILIVTDDEEATHDLAAGIASVPLFEGCSVSVLKSDGFYGTDILPAHAFFLGCGSPSPLSFTYIEILLGRINLAGRACGIFSSNPKALRYLSGVVRDSGAFVGKPLLAKNGVVDGPKLGEWVKTVLKAGGGL
ncbi:MAG: hypothetical protein FWB79_04160 [Treponema sp.]|nr:hypothetical protein [Treponema sp.]